MNYSKITNYLYVGTPPKGDDFSTLHDMGVDFVINMVMASPPRRDPHSPPIKVLWLPTIDSPLFPLPMWALEKGVREALEVIRTGGIVYTHCSKGRHRGPAMAACILIAEGMTSTEALELIKHQRPVSDLRMWYIKRRVLKFEEIWKEKN